MACCFSDTCTCFETGLTSYLTLHGTLPAKHRDKSAPQSSTETGASWDPQVMRHAAYGGSDRFLSACTTRDQVLFKPPLQASWARFGIQGLMHRPSGWVSRSAAVPTPSMWKVRRAGEDALRKGSGLIYADLNLESKICLWLGLGHMLSCVFDPSCFALRTWPGMRISGCTVFGPSAKEPPTFPARQPVVRRISLKSCSVPAGPVLHKRR